MADISKQSVSGDLEVSRNMAAGGGLTVSGKTELGGRVVVKDWLDAPNIVGAGKGIFPSYDDLYARYPRPMGGWWAITNMTIKDSVFYGCVYVAVRGKWELQTDDAVSLQINVPDVGTSDKIETLQSNVATLQTNIDKKQDALELYAESGNAASVTAGSFTYNGSEVLNMDNVYNGLDQTKEGYALDARQGKALQTNIDSEANARSDADNTLQTNIDAEASARANADNTLQANIDSEASARQAADNALQANIDAEASARQAADSTLQANIDSEANARQAADNTLQTNIDSEANARTSADSTLQANIDAEANARQDADSTLQTNIDGEASARQDADNALQANIDGEASARSDADETLQANIDKKQDALELYAESGEAASVTAGSFTYNGSEVVTEEELAAHTLTEEEIDAIVECFMFRSIGVICKDELDCLLEGFEFVGLDGLVTKVEAEGDGMVELVAENEEGVATVRGKTTIGCVDEEEVERMFEEVSKE